MIPVRAGDVLSFGLNSTDSRTYVCSVNLTDKQGNPYSIDFERVGTGSLATAASTEKQVPADGFLHSAAGDQQNRAVSNTGPGTVIMALALFRGGRVITSLFQDYYYTGHSPSYPRTGEGGSPQQGRIVTISGTDPAAGTEVADTVPVNQRWRLLSWEVVLVTDATVANRNTNFFVDDAGATATRSALLTDATNQTATQTRTHGYYPGTDNASTASVSVSDTVTILAKFPMQLQKGIWLKAGDRLRTVTTGIVAGDNYGAARYVVEAFFADVSGGA